MTLIKIVSLFAVHLETNPEDQRINANNTVGVTKEKKGKLVIVRFEGLRIRIENK